MKHFRHHPIDAHVLHLDLRFIFLGHLDRLLAGVDDARECVVVVGRRVTSTWILFHQVVDATKLQRVVVSFDWQLFRVGIDDDHVKFASFVHLQCDAL